MVKEDSKKEELGWNFKRMVFDANNRVYRRSNYKV